MNPPEINTTPPVKSNRKIVILTILLVIALLGAGVLGFLLKKEADKLGNAVNELRAQTKIVNDNAQSIRDAKLEPSFRKTLQQAANRSCDYDSAILYNPTTSLEKKPDGSIKKYFAVSQYFCNSGNQTILGYIGYVAAQSYDGMKWEFTFGNGTADLRLPNYIYNTDPELFNRKYNNPAHR